MTRDERNPGVSYSEDIFENPPQGPIGVHRGNTSLLSRTIPYIIVLVVAVLSGLLVWGVYSGELSKTFGFKPIASTTQTTTKKNVDSKVESKKQDTQKQDTDKDSTQTQPQTPAPTVNKQTEVEVVNASGINGYAGQKKAVLDQAGYTNVLADNPSGQIPDQTVVWYGDEADKATAQDVATTLGIGSVQQQSGIAHPIVVVLKN